jgi:hypothetical protein
MLTAFRLLFVTILAATLWSGEAAACSCARMTRADGIASAALAFEGRVISTRPLSPDEKVMTPVGSRAEQATRFQVITALKGDLPDVIEVLTHLESSSCGQDYEPHLGKEVTVGTYVGSLPPTTGLCLHLILNPPEIELKRQYRTFAPIEPRQVWVRDGHTLRFRGELFDIRLMGFSIPDTPLARCDGGPRRSAPGETRLRQIVRGGGLDFRFVDCACPSGTPAQCSPAMSCGVLRSAGRDVADMLIAEKLAAPPACESGCPSPITPSCRPN